MKELTALLERAARAYYAEDAEIMSNREYDALCDELSALEKKTGVVLAGSPTVRVGYEAVDFLPKERHEKPMLSLGKTKSREELRAWLGEQEGLLSWKLDGLTVVLTYENGALSKAVTRGNGEIGEVITPNARVFCNLPLAIPFRGKLILRGEAIIRYSDFAVLSRTSEEEGEAESRYKNPRNLCSGSVRQLNSEVTAKRRVHLYAFALVEAQGEADFHNSRERQLLFLQEQGFETVPYVRVSGETILNEVERFSREVETFDLPSDGLVLTYDDIAYGESLGRTAKFPRDSIAFKWADEVQETTLLAVEWSASRTGLINPVAVFAPVELEGTTVQRASVHNVSIVRSLQLGIGDRISVYKANMIIPQIAENLTRSDTLEIPAHCPVCGEATQVRQDNDAQVLVCPNPECTAKKIKAFTLFTSRNAMNIDGLSEMTLEKLIAGGFIHNYDDIYHLDRYREQIEQMDGFGEKSFANLQAGVEASRHTELPRLIYALGIPGIGAANAKLLCRHFADDLAAMLAATQEELAQIEGIGPVLAGAFADYFAQETNRKRLEELCGELVIRKNEYPEEAELPLAGKVFVITGAVNHFANRNELKARIESLGGKATGSVTSKTSYLINNDVHSTTGKNKKAQELGVPVISEEDFLEMVREKE
ncbi:MAG: NAD-dependent DNA ligase LigA [Eubacteriales bacterium]|nr:NAD-dependent DNA ligase LigA [Eubacteriales bacterium]